VSTETQQSLAEMSATPGDLSVGGILCRRRSASRPSIKFLVNRRLAALQIRQAMVGRWFFMIIGTIFSILPAFVYWLAGTMAAAGNPDAPTAGAIVAFTTLQSRLFFPLGQLLNVQVEIQGSLALFDRIFEYLDTDPEIVDAPDAVAMDHASMRGKVRFRDVGFEYPTEAVQPGPRGGPDARRETVTTSSRRARTSWPKRVRTAALDACRPSNSPDVRARAWTSPRTQ
jgi:ATP-binding cassette subfamily B protein